MTPDTTALRAQAKRYALFVPEVPLDTFYALCDGYDEAARLRGRRVEISRHPDMPAECRVWRNDVLVFDGVERSALLSRPAAVANRDAARQALREARDELRAERVRAHSEWALRCKAEDALTDLVADLSASRDDIDLLRVAAEATPEATHATVLRRRLLRVLDMLGRHVPEEVRACDTCETPCRDCSEGDR